MRLKFLKIIVMKNVVFWDVALCRSCTASQKTTFFIVTAVEASNLTIIVMCVHSRYLLYFKVISIAECDDVSNVHKNVSSVLYLCVLNDLM
jgi:hypothetical protein